MAEFFLNLQQIAAGVGQNTGRITLMLFVSLAIAIIDGAIMYGLGKADKLTGRAKWKIAAVSFSLGGLLALVCCVLFVLVDLTTLKAVFGFEAFMLAGVSVVHFILEYVLIPLLVRQKNKMLYAVIGCLVVGFLWATLMVSTAGLTLGLWISPDSAIALGALAVFCGVFIPLTHEFVHQTLNPGS